MTAFAPLYTGSCHCGAIRIEVKGPIEGVELCNCSSCARTGYLHFDGRHWGTAMGRRGD